MRIVTDILVVVTFGRVVTIIVLNSYRFEVFRWKSLDLGFESGMFHRNLKHEKTLSKQEKDKIKTWKNMIET